MEAFDERVQFAVLTKLTSASLFKIASQENIHAPDLILTTYFLTDRE